MNILEKRMQEKKQEFQELSSIAFIPDGNRRFAKKSGYSLIQSYQMGTQKAWQVLEWLLKYPQIKVGSFYTLSLENMQKRGSELKVLFKIFEKELERVRTSALLNDNSIRLKFIGRTSMLPKKLQEKMLLAEEHTAAYKNKTINLAIGYNGQAEIVDAAKRLALQFKNSALDLDSIDEEKFKNYLYSDFSFPDLIIRTSGTKRLSGFLTYQSVYSELCFVEKYWPELQENDLDSAIADYYERQRRFGF